MTLNHILSVIFYCDFDALSFNFSSTFRKTEKDKNNDDILKRNQIEINNMLDVDFQSLLAEIMDIEGGSKLKCIKLWQSEDIDMDLLNEYRIKFQNQKWNLDYTQCKQIVLTRF